MDSKKFCKKAYSDWNFYRCSWLFFKHCKCSILQEYTYQVKSGEKIENIATEHGVTAQEILDANGLSSIDGKKILLPKVQDKTVTATTLNIRSQPNTKSSIIGKYKKGDVLRFHS